jgi:cell division protein FtsQ
MKPGPVLRTRVLPALAALLVAGGLGLAAWYGYGALMERPIARVAFGGEVEKLARADLEALARDVQTIHSMAEVRERARHVPWVRDASVRRDLADRIEITFETHDVLARWGDHALVSSRGEIFSAPFTGALPRLRGPDGRAGAMASEYPAIARALAPIGSPIAELRLSARGAWQVVLESGLVLELGRGDIQPRIARFVAAWPQLAAQGVETAHADLRHANGFALRRAATLSVTPVTPPAVRPATRSKPQR